MQINSRFNNIRWSFRFSFFRVAFFCHVPKKMFNIFLLQFYEYPFFELEFSEKRMEKKVTAKSAVPRFIVWMSFFLNFSKIKLIFLVSKEIANSFHIINTTFFFFFIWDFLILRLLKRAKKRLYMSGGEKYFAETSWKLGIKRKRTGISRKREIELTRAVCAYV